MRLIDADEVLKRWGLKFYAMGGDRLGPNGDEISFYVNGLLNEIQNAPTVCNDNYSMGYQDGVKKVLSERPQGEWIKEEKDIVRVKCSLCGFKYADYGILFDYCPHCGADMRGGRE